MTPTALLDAGFAALLASGVSGPAVGLLVAVTVAGLLEYTVAEPPARWHPVAWLGRGVAALDRDWRRPDLAGVVIAVCVPALAAAVGAGSVLGVAWLTGWLTGGAADVTGPGGPGATLLATSVTAGLVLFSTTSLRRLIGTCRDVLDRLREPDDEGGLARAREELPALVGRDPGALSPAEVRSATIESASENLSDGFLAPVWWFLVGGVAGFWFVGAAPVGPALAGAALAVPGGTATVVLATAAAGAAWCKAVNTLDSMLGYPDRAIGRASARLDDAAMWLPARLTAAVLAAASGRPRSILAARDEATVTASPNAGWPMGVTAVAHDVRLAKPGAYELWPAGRDPAASVADRAVRTVELAGVATYVILALALVVLSLAPIVLASIGVVSS